MFCFAVCKRLIYALETFYLNFFLGKLEECFQLSFFLKQVLLLSLEVQSVF